MCLILFRYFVNLRFGSDTYFKFEFTHTGTHFVVQEVGSSGGPKKLGNELRDFYHEVGLQQAKFSCPSIAALLVKPESNQDCC